VNDTTETRIKAFIAEKLLFNAGGFPYPDDASFLSEGIVDSIGVMELVSFVQKTLGVAVDPAEVLPDNFDSVAKLAAFVRRKQSAGSVAAGQT
jgi:acyl carrier protein